jgi:hypothetical protein
VVVSLASGVASPPSLLIFGGGEVVTGVEGGVWEMGMGQWWGATSGGGGRVLWAWVRFGSTGGNPFSPPCWSSDWKCSYAVDFRKALLLTRQASTLCSRKEFAVVEIRTSLHLVCSFVLGKGSRELLLGVR